MTWDESIKAEQPYVRTLSLAAKKRCANISPRYERRAFGVQVRDLQRRAVFMIFRLHCGRAVVESGPVPSSTSRMVSIFRNAPLAVPPV